MKNNIFLIVTSFCCIVVLQAQDLKTTEIRVTEGFVPSIPEATKLNEQATFSDTAKVDKTQQYEVNEHRLKSNYKTRPLKAAKVKAETIPKLYKNKVSVGTGFRIGTKASITHNSTRSKTLSYGVLFNHFNNNVKVDKKLAGKSNNNLHLYAKTIKEKDIYIANLDYERTGVFTYGIGTGKKDVEGFENNPYYNRFAYTKFSISSISTEKTSDKMIRNTTFFISDLNERSENQIHLSSNLSKTINSFACNLEIGFDNYLRYNNSDSQFENTDLKILGFSPTASFKRFGIDFDLGFDFDMDDDFAIGFFPKIKATKELVKDVLLIYGGLDHSEQKHTLKSLSDENPYIHSFGTNQSILRGSSFLQELEITDAQELYLAMRNVLGKDEVFYGSIAYGNVTNFAYFDLLDTIDYSRFVMNYVDVWQLHANASYDKRINNLVNLNINADYYSWDKEIYHRPNLTFDISTPINLRDKIKLMPRLSYLGDRKSLNGTSSERLPSQIHFNLELQYNYSKILSAYLQLNNLTNSKKELWRNYQEIGFNGVFGVSYSF